MLPSGSPNDPVAATRALVALLRLACSGELAAALAYRGHRASLSDPDERAAIAAIEEEEWHHRRRVRAMLADLGEAPRRRQELRAWYIGRALSLLCRVSGWLLPMYGAGRLESRNVREYETAARLALAAGRAEWTDELLAMAEVEWEHEAYFRARVLSRPLGRRLPRWTVPPPKPAIRAAFAAHRTRVEAHGQRARARGELPAAVAPLARA